MKEDIAIRVEGLSKAYKLYDRHVDRLKESVNIFRKKYHRDFYALKDVSFEVKKGECLGVIGKNGSGKSTLLKIITGVLTPTSGSIRLGGKVSALLELGIGFNPDMTGIENIYFNGAIMGYSKKEMDAKIDEIVSFADIGEFISQPLKTYSTGMFMRLAFAAAINVDPDILIIDESLAVGDMRFQQKCFRKIREFRENGNTIIFVSHDMGTVVNLCDKSMWLNNNTVYRYGDPQEISREYTSFMVYDNLTIKSFANKALEKTDAKEDIEWEDLEAYSFFGEGGAEIQKVALSLKNSRKKVSVLQGGEDVIFALDAVIKSDIHLPIIGIGLKDKYGNDILAINTYIDNAQVQPLLVNDRLIVEFGFKFPLLTNGEYVFTAAIAEGTQENHIQHHWVHDAYIIKVSNNDIKHRMGHYFITKDVNIKLTKSDIGV